MTGAELLAWKPDQTAWPKLPNGDERYLVDINPQTRGRETLRYSMRIEDRKDYGVGFFYHIPRSLSLQELAAWTPERAQACAEALIAAHEA